MENNIIRMIYFGRRGKRDLSLIDLTLCVYYDVRRRRTRSPLDHLHRRQYQRKWKTTATADSTVHRPRHKLK